MARRRLHVKATADDLLACSPRNLIRGAGKRQIARNNPVCEPGSFAGHLVRVSVAGPAPASTPCPEKARGRVRQYLRWRCQPG